MRAEEGRSEMQPTFYASFTNGEAAERTVGALLEIGVAPDDISLVVKQATRPGADVELVPEPLMVDAGEGGTYGDRTGRQTEGSFSRESQVGGGIGTSSPDDDVSGIEEMDDSETVSEDMIYPTSGTSYSSQEDHDVTEAANTGFFNTTIPGRHGNHAHDGHLDELDSLLVPGFGLVLGGGDLATELIGGGMATDVGGNPAAPLMEYLTDQGVSPDLAHDLGAVFDRGGAVLAVAVSPGKINSEIVLRMLEEAGARNAELVEA